MERKSRGKWASRVERSQFRVEDGHRAGVGRDPQVDLVTREGFKMAPGARRRVDLVTSARELYDFYPVVVARVSEEKKGHPIIIVEVDFYHIFVAFKSPF